MGVAAQSHLGTEGRFVQRVLLLQEERVGGKKSRRRQPVQCGRERDHGHIELAARNLIQACQPLGNQIRVR